MIGGVDSDTMVGVIQGGKVEPGGAKMNCSDLEVLQWKIAHLAQNIEHFQRSVGK